MTSRARPSLLALFDPLTVSEASSLTPARDTLSPSPSLDSGSDKENLTSTTPRGSWTKACAEGASDTRSTCVTGSLVEVDTGKDRVSEMDLLGQSFLLEPKDDDSSNLCRVKLQDELDNACKLEDTEDILQRGNERREPLSEISLLSRNNNARTPQSVARGKRLIDIDTPSTTPKSMRKFATGVGRCEQSTTSAASPLSFHPPVASITPSNGAALAPTPIIPFSSNSPSLLNSTLLPDPIPAFHDPPSEQVSSSFDIHDSSSLRKTNFSGDLLSDDLSFLERLEDDSFADFGRGNCSDRTASSLGTPQEAEKRGDPQKADVRRKAVSVAHGVQAKAEMPARKASDIFRRSSSHSGLTFGTKQEGLSMILSSPINLEPRTPSSPSVPGINKRGSTLAPKKTQTVIRRSNTLSRSTVGTIKEQSETKADGLQAAKVPRTRPRPSSLEIKPHTRSLSLGIKKSDVSAVTKDAPALERRASLSRPSIVRRPSIGKSLSPTRPKVVGPARIQDEGQKRPVTSLAQNPRRLSMSASSKPTPIKTNNFATTGRLGGPRRVPLTANAPLFKTIEPTITEVQSPKLMPRASSLQTKTGPQRPPIPSGISGTLGRSTSKPKATSPERTGSSSIISKSRTLGRTASVSSGLFSRSSFMTSRSSGMVSMSRLPKPPSKSNSRIPGPGTRMAF